MLVVTQTLGQMQAFITISACEECSFGRGWAWLWLGLKNSGQQARLDAGRRTKSSTGPWNFWSCRALKCFDFTNNFHKLLIAHRMRRLMQMRSLELCKHVSRGNYNISIMLRFGRGDDATDRQHHVQYEWTLMGPYWQNWLRTVDSNNGSNNCLEIQW